MTRAQHLKNVAEALQALLQTQLIESDRTYYQARLTRVEGLLEKIENPEPDDTKPVKTAMELLEEYDSLGDVTRWYQRQAKLPLTPEVKAWLEESQVILGKSQTEIASSFAKQYATATWLPETRAEKLAIRDQIYDLSETRDGLEQLLTLQALGLERQGHIEWLAAQRKQQQLEFDELQNNIQLLKQQLLT